MNINWSQEHHNLLQELQNHYGVQPHFIAADKTPKIPWTSIHVLPHVTNLVPSLIVSEKKVHAVELSIGLLYFKAIAQGYPYIVSLDKNDKEQQDLISMVSWCCTLPWVISHLTSIYAHDTGDEITKAAHGSHVALLKEVQEISKLGRFEEPIAVIGLALKLVAYKLSFTQHGDNLLEVGTKLHEPAALIAKKVLKTLSPCKFSEPKQARLSSIVLLEAIESLLGAQDISIPLKNNAQYPTLLTLDSSELALSANRNIEIATDTHNSYQVICYESSTHVPVIRSHVSANQLETMQRIVKRDLMLLTLEQFAQKYEIHATPLHIQQDKQLLDDDDSIVAPRQHSYTQEGTSTQSIIDPLPESLHQMQPKQDEQQGDNPSVQEHHQSVQQQNILESLSEETQQIEQTEQFDTQMTDPTFISEDVSYQEETFIQTPSTEDSVPGDEEPEPSINTQTAIESHNDDPLLQSHHGSQAHSSVSQPLKQSQESFADHSLEDGFEIMPPDLLEEEDLVNKIIEKYGHGEEAGELNFSDIPTSKDSHLPDPQKHPRPKSALLDDDED